MRAHLRRRVQEPLGKPLLFHHVNHLHAIVAKLVVELALARVGEDRVRGSDLIEPLARLGILVGVVAQRELVCGVKSASKCAHDTQVVTG